MLFIWMPHYEIPQLSLWLRIPPKSKSASCKDLTARNKDLKPSCKSVSSQIAGSEDPLYLLTYVLTLTNKVTYFQLLYSQRRPFKQINYRHIITTQKHLHAYSFQITFKSSSLNTVLQNTKLTRYMHFIFLWSRPFKQTNKQTDSERIII